MYQLIFSVKYNFEIMPKCTILPGNVSEPFSYCIRVGTSEISEQMFCESNRISCLPKKMVLSGAQSFM